MRTAYEITFSFQSVATLPIKEMLEKLQKLVVEINTFSPHLNEWLLGGETKEEAYLYNVFENGIPTTAVQAVLETRYKKNNGLKIIGIWNGQDGDKGASIQYIQSPAHINSLVTFNGRPESFTNDWKLITKVIETGVEIWNPKAVSVESNGYFGKEVFPDRYRVSWMLYLPKVITAQQVPEARALVPVMTKDKKPVQKGTIIVSVIDEAFTDQNPEHVKIANEIEIRMVNEDLLPLHKDL